MKRDKRGGILPSILGALISARSTTRQALKETSDPAMRAVLDSRQKALKVTANALYGFTGAQASNLQCAPLADSCLAMGAASTRTARELLEEKAAQGTACAQHLLLQCVVILDAAICSMRQQILHAPG